MLMGWLHRRCTWRYWTVSLADIRMCTDMLFVVCQAMAFMYDKDLVSNLFNEAGNRYADRQGGYTRVKAEPYLRRGDATEMAIIELV